ncbi:MAG: helix-turn-helix transcriptional regulator [Myxococcota bacterium]|jgi:transcriptional regulator with XRE-family HTH domain|nr:helix-turn-helix transcriptional regulator [Myxococcota bacterium]
MRLSVREQSPENRRLFYEVVQTLLLDARLTMGQALRLLRAVHLGVTRRQFAKMVGLSSSALSELENDAGNPTLSSIEQAFKPFGFRVGLVPVRGSAVQIHPPELDPERLEALSTLVLDAVGRRAPRA